MRQITRNAITIVVSYIVLAILCGSPLAQTLPEGRRLTVTSGTYQAYTLEEMKILFKMEVQLQSSTKEIPKLELIIEDLKQIRTSQDKILAEKDSQISLLKTDNARLTEKWSKENELRHVCENKPQFGSWLAWSIAAVATSAAVTLGFVMAFDRNR